MSGNERLVLSAFSELLDKRIERDIIRSLDTASLDTASADSFTGTCTVFGNPPSVNGITTSLVTLESLQKVVDRLLVLPPKVLDRVKESVKHLAISLDEISIQVEATNEQLLKFKASWPMFGLEVIKSELVPSIPVRRHRRRSWMRESYHRRIQKKWNKRFGVTQGAVFVDPSYINPAHTVA